SRNFARDTRSSLIRVMKRLGANRNEWSLVSKVLHWLIPWRIPVNDSYVRTSLQIPEAWSPNDQYREIVDREFALARKLSAEDSEWLGEVDPKSPLRAIDKYLWWKGGGHRGTAIIDKDPWKVVRDLGIDCKAR